MSRPVPTAIFHFTAIENLPAIVEHGLMSDSLCRPRGLTEVEIGSNDIKEWRSRRPVDAEPGGFVGDYVPFYFAPRSPMMFTLSRGNHGFTESFDRVVYLISTLERLSELGCDWIVSDRNAAQLLASFVPPGDAVDTHVDWPLMQQRQWGRTQDDPERPDRRAAECLLHQTVPFEVVSHIVARTEATARRVRRMVPAVEVSVRPEWYF